MWFADASVGRLNTASMNFRVDVCSYTVGSRWPGLANGEMLQVLEELLLGTVCALVVRKPLPEDDDVVGVAKGDAVHADVVDLPRHIRGVEQVEDDRVVEDTVAPDAVGGDAA